MLKPAPPENLDAVRADEQRFRTLAETLSQLIWTAMPDGRVDYFSRRWFDYTGATPEQTLGDNWTQVLHPDDRGHAWQEWRTALRSGEPLEVQYRIRGVDGGYRWFLVHGTPIRDAAGRIVQWCGSCTNIHAQKEAEQALKDAARKIRQEPWGKPMVLIALTGLGQGEDKQHALDAGFDHHLVKPIDAITLTRLLESREPSIKSFPPPTTDFEGRLRRESDFASGQDKIGCPPPRA